MLGDRHKKKSKIWSLPSTARIRAFVKEPRRNGCGIRTEKRTRPMPLLACVSRQSASPRPPPSQRKEVLHAGSFQPRERRGKLACTKARRAK